MEINKYEEALKTLWKKNSTLTEKIHAYSEPIAIIGMSCRFGGGANSLESFWQMLSEGRSGISEVPLSRWDNNYYYDSNPEVPGKIITKLGGFLNTEVDKFDAEFFDISPREAQDLDPQHRLILEVAWEALELSGIAPQSLAGSPTGVFLGLCSTDFSTLIAESGDKESISPYWATGSAHSTAAGRISYILGLKGPSIALDTACSSSMVAVHEACKSLHLGESSLAIAGGANLILTPLSMIGGSKLGALAPDGKCKTFDAKADGFVRGEGCGVIVLKRLSEAIRDNDSILAVISSSGVNQDGASGGLTIPSGDAQEALIRAVVDNAHIKPDEVDFVEAHGTGTPLGDPIEVRALGAVYGERNVSHPLIVGTVKTNIGHTEAAAGIAGVIKVVLSLLHNTIPAHLNFENLNPHISVNFPLEIPLQSKSWKRENHPRRAGLSAFGFSGTNAHIIIEEAPEKAVAEPTPERPFHIIGFSAKSKQALEEYLRSFQKYLTTTSEGIGDIAYTANAGRNHFEHRVAVVAKSVDDLKEQLEVALSRIIKVQESTKSKITFSHKEEGGFYKHPTQNNKIQIDIGPDTDWQKLLLEVANEYQNGTHIDWKALDERYQRKKVFLPTYPFQRQRYWPECARPVYGKRFVHAHPLVGEKHLLPNGDFYYFGEINLAQVPYFKDHRVFLYNICPGTTYLEMMIASALEAFQIKAIKITDIAVEAPLTFDSKKSVNVLVTIKMTEEGYGLEVYTQDEMNVWRFHAKGTVKPAEAIADLQKMDVEVIKSRLTTTVNKEQFYKYVHSIGLNLSGSFEIVEKMYIGDKEAFAEVIFTGDLKGYFAHPALFDGCLQTVVGVLWNEKQEELMIPVGFDLLECHAPLQSHVLVHAQVTKVTDMGRSFDVLICDLVGNILVRISGFHARKTTEQSLTKMLVHKVMAEDWLYEWTWQERSLGEVSISSTFGHWLVFSDGNVSDALVGFIESNGGSCQIIPREELPKTKDAFVDLLYIALLQEKPLAGILHIASAGEVVPLTADSIRDAQTVGTKSFLHLSQALVLLQESLQVPVFLITKQCTSTNLAHSPLVAMFKTITLEHSELDIKLVDLGVNWDFKLLLKAVFSKNEETFMVVNDSRVLIPRLIKAKSGEFADVANQKSSLQVRLGDEVQGLTFQGAIRPDATYLIIGGQGGLGITLAKWLIENGVKHLVLTGRREPDNSILQSFQIPGVTVTYEVLDVSEEKAVANLLERLNKSENPLKGIFHLAVVLDDATLMEQDWSRFEKVFAPKVYGSLYLHQYSKDLDFFVMFSSAAASIGNPGQSNYAAANGFMDALCAYRKEQGLPAHSLAWGPWAAVGLAKDLGSRHAKSGLIAMKPEEGMRAFEIAMRSSSPTITLININWNSFVKQMVKPPSWFQCYAEHKEVKGNLLDKLEGEAPEGRYSILENFVSDVVKNVLGIAKSQKIDTGKSFFKMGLDSLMAVDLKNRLQSGLGKTATLGTTAVFDHSTVKEMSEHIAGMLKIKEVEATKPKEIATLMSTLSSPKWIEREVIDMPKMRLVCFHHAGGNASAFRGWEKQMLEGVEINLIQLPGRENRYNEQPLTDLKTVVHGILQALLQYMDLPYVVFAHSMGTMIASEVIKSIQEMNLPMPKHVIFSACVPLYFHPEKFSKSAGIGDLADDKLIDFVSNTFDGIPARLLQDRALLDPLVPSLRADLKILESNFELKDPLKIDMTTIRCSDDKACTKEEILEWSKVITGRYLHIDMLGGHMEIMNNPLPFIDIINKTIKTIL